MRKQLTVLVGLALTSALSHAAVTYDFQNSVGEVKFEAVGKPKLMKINGHGKGVVGSLSQDKSKMSGELSFELGTLGTDIDLRDRHMKDKYLQVGQFPTAKLSDIEIALPAGWMESAKEAKDLEFTAQLELHGVKKPVKGKVNLQADGEKVALKAEFPLKLSAHSIDIPSFAGVTVAEDITVTVDTAAAVAKK